MKNKSSVIGTFDGVSGDSTMNNNEMLLSKELWEKLFSSEEFNHYLSLGHYMGFLGHPEDPGCQDFKNACIILREAQVDSNGVVHAKFDLIDTPVGRIVKTLIDAGVKFGISVRGVGDVGADGYVDPDTFVFRGFDLVAFPAYDNAIPEYMDIAASTNNKLKKSYKSVCESIQSNLDKITSTTAIEVLKSQFSKSSPQYKLLDEKQRNLTSEDSFTNQRIHAMTDMYLSEHQRVVDLESEVDKSNKALRDMKRTNDRVNAATERIYNEQIDRMKKDYEASENRYRLSQSKYKSVVSANSKLKTQLESVKADNLKYRQKVNSSNNLLEKKDSTIESLRSELSKTVEASKDLKRTSNRDAQQLESVRRELKATHDMLQQYQDAYATLYASILGVNCDSISITASTSVDELKSAISQSTNTANIPALSDMTMPIDIVDDENDDYFDDEDMVTL